jgi:hypothetical protein
VAGILKPSSAPMGVIQDTCLNDTHKGRGYSLKFATPSNTRATANIRYRGVAPSFVTVHTYLLLCNERSGADYRLRRLGCRLG